MLKGPALYFVVGLMSGGVFLSLFGEQLHDLVRHPTAPVAGEEEGKITVGGSEWTEAIATAATINPPHQSPADSPSAEVRAGDGFESAQTKESQTKPTETASAYAEDALYKVLEQVASSGKMVVATSTDYGYLQITINWMCHMRKLGLEKNVMIFSLDEKIHAAIQEAGFISYYETKMAKSEDTIGNWNSKSYNQVVHTKTKHQRAVLERGFNLFFTDIDIPWMADYRTTIIADTPADASFVGQQNWPQCDMNVGFFFAKSTKDMIQFFGNVIELELALERRDIPLGMDPRKDIFDPSDDQSVIAFNMLCGSPNGTYPGRGNNDRPQGGPPPEGSTIEVQPKWQRRMLFRLHQLNNRKVKNLDHTRVFEADCTHTTGIKFKYGFLPPKWYQTGHKDWTKYEMDVDLYTNASALYHPNFMKGKDNKINALKKYNRWIEEC